MTKEQIPGNADPDFKEVMKAIRSGKNPDHAKRKRLDEKHKRIVDKALRAAERKRKGGRHRTGGSDDVIDTGMFGS